MWKITHKRKNGTYVNDEAMEIGVSLFSELSYAIFVYKFFMSYI